ncbi:MAG: hypothetical protein HYZ14_07670 [Bacteroidetes bacterium]|nr:hypothetical protein [Bacteroidota bacterium]
MRYRLTKKGEAQIDENSLLYKAIQKFERYELYILLLLVLLILVFAAGLTGVEMLITGLLSTISVFYFFTAFLILPDMPDKEKVMFMFKLAGVGSAVAVVGLQFALLSWPGSRPMLIGGSLSLLVCFLFSLFTKIQEESIQKRILFIRVRALFLAIVCAVYIFTPREILIENGLKKLNPTEQLPAQEPGSNPTPHP